MNGPDSGFEPISIYGMLLASALMVVGMFALIHLGVRLLAGGSNNVRRIEQ
jgi:hypothetical protein